MNFQTEEQIRTIKDALELALDMRLRDFNRDKDTDERLAKQRAIRAARDVRRFNEVLCMLNQQKIRYS